jgi:hypothetical protein
MTEISTDDSGTTDNRKEKWSPTTAVGIYRPQIRPVTTVVQLMALGQLLAVGGAPRSCPRSNRPESPPEAVCPRLTEASKRRSLRLPGPIDLFAKRHADVQYIAASRGRNLTLTQALCHPTADAGRIANPGHRPEKVLTVSCCPDFDNFRQPLPNDVETLAVARVLSFLLRVPVAIQRHRMTPRAARNAAHLQRGFRTRCSAGGIRLGV